ncbi:hypothetical protein [Luteolibacter sp. AS25]|uniref:hypothetical protein n=1 Tax=Luteolibacter sp. AS25 TaxID=3135776 RepID=UPI00398A7684
MKTILLLLLGFLLVSCDRFNRDELISRSFDADLGALTAGRKTDYSDGLLLVHGVTDSDPLYAQFFSKSFSKGEVHLSFGDTQFNSKDVGKIRYRLLDSFDGYTKTIFYIPSRKILGFGFSDGLLN